MVYKYSTTNINKESSEVVITTSNSSSEPLTELVLELDCEYYSSPTQPWHNESLTTQIKRVGDDNGVVFTHGEWYLTDCPSRKHNNPIVEYLDYNNLLSELPSELKEDGDKCYEIDINRFKREFSATTQDKTTPKLYVQIWGYFLVADILKAFMGKERQWLRWVIAGKYEDIYLEHGRHLKAYHLVVTPYSVYRVDGIPTPFYVRLGEGCEQYQIYLDIKDISAIMGKCSYEQAGKATGVKLPDKSLMNDYKQDMRIPIVNNPDEFIRYALGDLHCREIWDNYCNLWNQVCDDVGVTRIEPKLTIGATVRDFLLSYFGLDKEGLKKYKSHESTAEYLKTKTDTTAQYLTKIDGGRCHNNKPWISSVKNKQIVDIDIQGCYRQAISVDGVFPIGKPMTLSYPKTKANKESEHNKYLTLRQFLKKYSKDLVPFLYVLKVSTPKDYKLKHPQDFLLSWYPPKNIQNMSSDTDKQGIDQGILNVDNDGETKINTHEVHLATITHDVVQFINNVCSERSRNELLDKLQVITAMYYPVSDRVNTLDELDECIENHKGENTCEAKKIKGKTTKITKNQECYKWVGIPLNKLMNLLTSMRNKYDKYNPDEKPLNNLYKLIGNTIYGDFVSPYFCISNVVLGSNITARARIAVWCAEKGLNTYQTITDGGMFVLDKAITNGKRNINTVNTIYLKNPHDVGLQYKNIEGDNPDEIARNAIEHLNSLFPNLDIFKKQVFNLEVKMVNDEYIANGLAVHGASDYALYYPSQTIYKMRGYNDKMLDENGNNIPVINPFLDNLYNNPQQVLRNKPRLESYILKTKQYKADYWYWKDKGLTVGDTVIKTRLLLECSINQFTFQTQEQREKWIKAYERLKRPKDQYDHEENLWQGFEMFYLNDDGSLDYQRMIVELQEDAASGKIKPRCMSDKSRNTHRKKNPHPHRSDRLEYKKRELQTTSHTEYKKTQEDGG